jgi:hypothetical protein
MSDWSDNPFAQVRVGNLAREGRKEEKKVSSKNERGYCVYSFPQSFSKDILAATLAKKRETKRKTVKERKVRGRL